MTRRPSRPPRALRSWLFAPGNHPRRVEKVFTTGADVAILDLEDAVPHAGKAAARAAVAAALAARTRAARPAAYVRINGADSPHWQDDLAAVVGPHVDGVIVPKAEDPESLRLIAGALGSCERTAGVAPGAIDLVLLVETARGVEAAAAIAQATPRASRLAFGGGDYTHDLDLEWTDDESALAYARARLAHASRLAGLEPPVDTVVLEVRDQARFLRSALNGRRMGFLGKLCIHPDQLAPCHEAFTPTAEDIARAREIVAAFEAAEARGVASIAVGGLFVDYPVVEKARRVLALAALISAPG